MGDFKMKKRVLVSDFINKIGVDMLTDAGVEVVFAPNPKVETLNQMAPEFDGIISRNTYIGEEIFSAAKRLKVVSPYGVGTDHIDMEAAKKHGVYVINTPGANSQSVAETALAFMFALSHRIIDGNMALKVDGDYYARNKLVACNLEKKVLGIIGLGNIGYRLARMCSCGLDMKILAYDPFISDRALAIDGLERREDLDDLFRESDFLSVNCPFTEDLYHVINADKFALMKPTAYLVNCARGQLVDRDALYDALRLNKIAGAASDVFEVEPPDTNHPIYSLPNFIATPHIATNCVESMDNMSSMTAEDILHVFNGEPEKAHLVNP
jgi:D-3-phosphoglycerate dehydrogenase